MIRHSFRRSLGAPVLTCTLTREGIVVERQRGKRETIPYDQIRAINLKSQGPQLGVPRYECRVAAANHQTLNLTNIDFVGLCNAIGRDHTYRRFVKALHGLVEPHRESMEFTRGSNVMYWLGWILMISAAVLLLGALLLLHTKGLITATGLGPAFAYGAFCTRAYQRDSYAPDDIPTGMLPEPDGAP